MRRDFADCHARRGRLERRDQRAECAGADRRRGADHVLSRHSAILASRCRGKLGASGMTGRQNRSHRVREAHTSTFQASDLPQRLGAFFFGQPLGNPRGALMISSLAYALAHSRSAAESLLSTSILVASHSSGCSLAERNRNRMTNFRPIGSAILSMDSGSTKWVPYV